MGKRGQNKNNIQHHAKMAWDLQHQYRVHNAKQNEPPPIPAHYAQTRKLIEKERKLNGMNPSVWWRPSGDLKLRCVCIEEWLSRSEEQRTTNTWIAYKCNTYTPIKWFIEVSIMHRIAFQILRRQAHHSSFVRALVDFGKCLP